MKKITILSSLGIGDIITLTPLLKKLKGIYPKSKIIIYSLRRGFLEKEKINFVDNIKIIKNLKDFFFFFKKRKDILIGLGYYLNISGRIKTIIYKLIFLFCNSKEKIYYNNLDEKGLKDKNMVEIKLEILKKLKINLKKEDYNLFIPFDFKKEKRKIKKILKKIKLKNRLVLFHIGSKKGYTNRFWAIEKWIKVIEYLNKNNRIVFVGRKEDKKEIQKIIEKGGFERIIDFSEKLSIKETTALIDKADLFISTNSGPMWIAAALKKPQIVLCGPSKFSWEPYNKYAKVIRKIVNRKDCNPPCDLKHCKYKDNLCMKKIGVEEVIKEINKKL